MNQSTPIIKDKIADCLKQAIIQLQITENCDILPTINLTIEHPQNPAHGDFASGLPMKIAGILKSSPLSIAEKIVNNMPSCPEISMISIASPGFINFTMSDSWLVKQVDTILSYGQIYGDLDIGKGITVQIEFVSVNPTGPLHVGHGRGAVLGSTLANVLAATGFTVEKEYYLNDTGTQIDTFSSSLYTRYCECLGRDTEMPLNGYFGDYIIDMVKKIIAENGDILLTKSPEVAILEIGKIGFNMVVKDIKQDLISINVDFDNWFSEKSLYQSGEYSEIMALLKKSGYVINKDNATWFETTALGEDIANVLVRSDGNPTYFASDIAYHFNKLVIRNFDTVIDIWGADHQGHVPRMKAAIKAFGENPDKLKVIICQLVTLRRGKETIKISKRSGDIISLRELIKEVGPDACRYFFLSRSANSQMDFDITLAKEQSSSNPVYYVQYAHARITSIIRLAKEKGIDYSRGDVSLLTTEAELTLIRQLILMPEILEKVTTTLEPQHLPHYTHELATSFHSFYKQCRVISENVALSEARLKLVKATQIVIAKSLKLMGISAPERM
jgi:arginyl-tRNA synthetase